MKEPERRRGVATVEIDAASGDVIRIERAGAADAMKLELAEADVWELVLTVGGRPCGRLVLPDLGTHPGKPIFETAVQAACRAERTRELVAESLGRRIGAAKPEYDLPRVSVVVCTRGRPSSLAALLDALAALDPAPAELVVVDNAPKPGEDCRGLAEAAGSVYVREDRAGLNLARQAGVAAASGELLAFTDDDCLPPPSWLAALAELFDNPNVGAATGPAFPAALDTRAQLRFERVASFSRGFQRRDWDFMTLPPALAGRTGAGANMVIRRELLERTDDVFPAELDAGTPTRSGGDAYALFKVLAAGRRVVYDPRLYTYHRHRADPDRLHEAIRGYGVGLGAVAMKLLVEERETDALQIYRWLVGQYLGTVAGGLVGVRDAVDVRLAWDYLRGGIAGPAAWRRARGAPSTAARASASPGGTELAPDDPASPGRRSTTKEDPAPHVSVVVITNRPGELPARCLAGLATQSGAPEFETILVDDSPGDGGATPIPSGLEVRLLRSGGRGAAVARNAGVQAASGALLLFLDDDLIPAADLVGMHSRSRRNGAEDSVVVGYSPPNPRERTLAALSASLWWEDHFQARKEQVATTFTDMLSGNVSIPRDTFDRVGPFDPEFGVLRREDWEWGVRARQAGVEIAYEPGAVAEHRFSLDARGRLAAARAEGAGDALLVERHPVALGSLPAAAPARFDSVAVRLAFRLLLDDRRRERAAFVFDALERLKLRPAWARWFLVAQRAAYEAGFRTKARRPDVALIENSTVSVQLCSEDAIPQPRVAAPALQLMLGGHSVGSVGPVDGQWTASLAQQAARRLSPLALAQPVTCLDGNPDRDGANQIEEVVDELVFIPLGGAVLTDAALERVKPALAGDRVAVVTGGLLKAGTFPGPSFFSRATVGNRYPLIGPASRYVAAKKDVYEALGGLDSEARSLGHQGAVVDLMDRALEAGWVVAHCDVPGSVPPGGIGQRLRFADLQRWWARGQLVRREARALGWRWWLRNGFVPLAARIRGAGRPGGPSWMGAVAAVAAFLAGSMGWRASQD